MSRLSFPGVMIPLAVCLLLGPGLKADHAAADARPALAAGGSPGAQSAAGKDSALSVLDLFRSYAGQRTIEGLCALFEQPTENIVRQAPLIAISDGRTAVIVAVRATPVDGRSINFSFEGGGLLSIRKIKKAEWELKALPARGTAQMTLLVKTGPETSRYPLTVAPGVPPQTDLSAGGFQAYLEREQAAADLNSDGRSDYLDDYTFTANFLARQRAAGRDKKARQQRALKKTLTVDPVH